MPPPLPWQVRVEPERLVLLCGGAALLLGSLWCTAAFAGLPAWTCIWKSCTGLPCLGCGATRSVLLLTDGRWMDAWRMNPAAVLTLAVLLAGLVYSALVLFFRLEPWRPRILQSWPWRRLAVAALAVHWIYLLVAGRA